VPLTEQDRQKLQQVAATEGVDPAALVSAAEKLADGQDAGGMPGTTPQSDQGPKLFMYLLPFVLVKEVRSKWLGLADAFPGDLSIASDWATAHPNAAPPDKGEA
jgi:hypothetical protein